MSNYQTIQERIVDRYGDLTDDKEKFSKSIREELKQTFRINSIKAEKEDVIEQMKLYDSSIREITWSDNAFESKINNLGSSIHHFSGHIYIQELTSMIPPLIVKDLLNETKVIDCCAAPGSKTTQIADLMKNKGHIIANDARYGRIKSLRGNLDRLGVTNTTVTMRDFKSFPNTEAEVYFVDAPCSSEGTIRKKKAITRKWREHDYQRFANMQKGLLSKACKMAPTGSTIIYSTCTFSPEENENVVNQIINEENIEVKEANIKGLKMQDGITEWKEDIYSEEVRKCKRIWPHHNDTDAFFIARMEKC